MQDRKGVAVAPTMLRLVDGTRELELWRLDPLRRDIIIDELNVAPPEPREVVSARPDDDGTDDDTRHHGAGTASLKLTVFDQPEGILAQIKPFLRYDRRPYLCLTDDEWPGERRIQLRATPWSTPIPHTGLGVWRECQFQWKTPDGVWFGADPLVFSLLATGGAAGGRVYAARFPRRYGVTTGVGQQIVTNPGDRDAHQVVLMYGPCRGPRYSCDDTGATVAFTDRLQLAAGEYVEVDTRAGTANLNSDPLASVVQHLDFATSSWWRLPSGNSRVRYHPVSEVDAGCAATVTAQMEFSP